MFFTRSTGWLAAHIKVNRFTSEDKLIMFCSNCGSNLEDSAKFCSKCGFAIPAVVRQAAQDERPTKPTGNRTAKQLTSGVFVLLVVVSTFAAAIIFSEKGVGTILFSALIAETFAATLVGFTAAKLITKNERRTWVEISLFQVLNIVGGSISLVAAGPGKALVAVGFAFVASALVFGLQKKSRLGSPQ